jgi:hypothetical protein
MSNKLALSARVGQGRQRCSGQADRYPQATPSYAQVRSVLDDAGAPWMKIIAQIDCADAIAALDEILAACDGIMVSRINLAMDIPASKASWAYLGSPFWVIMPPEHKGQGHLAGALLLLVLDDERSSGQKGLNDSGLNCVCPRCSPGLATRAGAAGPEVAHPKGQPGCQARLCGGPGDGGHGDQRAAVAARNYRHRQLGVRRCRRAGADAGGAHRGLGLVSCRAWEHRFASKAGLALGGHCHMEFWGLQRGLRQ